ncbi:efflux RND transporter permease subunit [Natronospirillum operosum]|uniref:Efflux RND transporter permease subunit n=1 Tax=Natronospirillum operosum TaxID=2759953 RepID=A0A4Z0WFT6_9GAMM|nr:efflux RND transporter permease subunit [Natronospirillum operosum]TGG94021.1 efflux RND transporter permease subunit [Natronospirillum operosum]
MTRILDHLREAPFLAYFARHRVAANLLMLFVILMGFMGLTRLPMQLFPDVTPGAAAVTVAWDGAGADAVVDRITEPLERELLELDAIDRVTSNSRDGYAALSIYFEAGSDMESAMRDLRTAVDSVSLPSGADDPTVREYEFSEPVIFTILSYDGPISDLRPFLDQMESDLRRRGIPETLVEGMDEPIVRIEVTPESLARHQWTVDSLADEIRQVNDRFSAGQAGEGENQRNVITGERRTSGLALRELPLGDNRTLGDVATILEQGEEPRKRLVFNDRNAVLVQVFRSGGMDSMTTSEIYHEWHNEVVPTLPAGVEVVVFGDNSEFVGDNVELLLTNGFYGLMLVLGTLFILLNLRVALWTAMGIPVALLGTMALLYFSGGSLNFFSMFAMMMALGIIVDNAIVVGEETQSMLERGIARSDAASLAVSRMYAPIVASSLTTMAAFSPLLFVPGMFGELLRPIPLVIIMVIAAALVECFLILPGHLHMSFGRSTGKTETGLRKRITALEHRVREQYYRPFITFMIRQRLLSVSIALSLFIVSIGMVAGGVVPFSEDLDIEAEEIFADVEFVEGAPEQSVVEFMETMQAGLRAAEAEFLERYDVPFEALIRDLYYEYDLDAGEAFFMARLPSPDDRPFSNNQFLRAWESHVELPQVVDRLRIASESGGGASASELNLRLAGEDAEQLRAGTQALVQALEDYGELRNVNDTLPATNRQVRLDLTPAARAQGLREQALAGQVAAAMDGVTVQTFTEFGSEVDVRLRLDEQTRQQLDYLSWLPISLGNGRTLPLSEVATLTAQEEPSATARENGRQAVTITADAASEDVNMQSVQADIAENVMPGILAQYGLSADYETGQDAAELLDNLVVAAYAAAALIFLILAWMFQSYTWPLAVMTSIPLAMTGAIFGHWVLRLDLNFLSLFGLFGLAGIVINGSIILISRYRELLADGWDRHEAIVEASCQRFRPVVLTTLTTVMGLVPILLETSVQAQMIRSMATSLAFGLGYGAFLVLLVIPCVLSYLQSMTEAFDRLVRWLSPKRPEAG